MVPLVSFLAALRILTEAQICNNGEGKIVFEKVSSFQSLSGELLFSNDSQYEIIKRTNIPPLKVLEECFHNCLENRVTKIGNCNRFDFIPGKRLDDDNKQSNNVRKRTPKNINGIKGRQQYPLQYDQSSCVLYNKINETINWDDISDNHGSIWQFDKVCLSSQYINKYCPNRPFVFEKISSFKLIDNDNNGKELIVQNKNECENKCLIEKEFICRSATYMPSTNKCFINSVNRHNRPTEFQYDQQYEYLENMCLKNNEICRWSILIIENQKQLDSKYEKHSIVTSSINNCSTSCLESLDRFGFVCRSFMFDEPSEQCILYDEDPINLTNNNINDTMNFISSNGNLYRVLCSTDDKDDEPINQSINNNNIPSNNNNNNNVQDSIETSYSQPGNYKNFILPVDRIRDRDHHRGGFTYNTNNNNNNNQNNQNNNKPTQLSSTLPTIPQQQQQQPQQQQSQQPSYTFSNHHIEQKQQQPYIDDHRTNEIYPNGYNNNNNNKPQTNYNQIYSNQNIMKPDSRNFNNNNINDKQKIYSNTPKSSISINNQQTLFNVPQQREIEYNNNNNNDNPNYNQVLQNRYDPRTFSIQPQNNIGNNIIESSMSIQQQYPSSIYNYHHQQSNINQYRTPVLLNYDDPRYRSSIQSLNGIVTTPTTTTIATNIQSTPIQYNNINNNINNMRSQLIDPNMYRNNQIVYPSPTYIYHIEQRKQQQQSIDDIHDRTPTINNNNDNNRSNDNDRQSQIYTNPTNQIYQIQQQRILHPIISNNNNNNSLRISSTPTYHHQIPSSSTPIYKNNIPQMNRIGTIINQQSSSSYSMSYSNEYPKNQMYHYPPTGQTFRTHHHGDREFSTSKMLNNRNYTNYINPYRQYGRNQFISSPLPGVNHQYSMINTTTTSTNISPIIDNYPRHSYQHSQPIAYDRFGQLSPGSLKSSSSLPSSSSSTTSSHHNSITSSSCNSEQTTTVVSFRKMGFNSRLKSKHIYKVARAERIEDCERYCLETKDFICKSFNFRPFFPDNCELSNVDTKKFKLEDSNHFEHNTQFDYYERFDDHKHGNNNGLDCFEVLQTCTHDGMELKLKTNDGFYGRIYTYGFYDSCFFDGNGGQTSILKISKPNGFPRCGTQQINPDAMTNIVVVQFNDYVQTSRDKKYNLTCYLSGPGEAVVTSNYLDTKTDGRHPMQIEHLPAQNVLTSNIVLRILYRGTPTNTIVVGDLLTFRLEALNQYRFNGYYNDIFATNVIAKDPYTGRQVLLIDSRGCPVDLYVFPELHKTPDGSLEAEFYAFKIPDSNFLVFQATVRTCKGPCEPVICKEKSRGTMMNNNIDGFGTSSSIKGGSNNNIMSLSSSSSYMDYPSWGRRRKRRSTIINKNKNITIDENKNKKNQEEKEVHELLRVYLSPEDIPEPEMLKRSLDNNNNNIDNNNNQNSINKIQYNNNNNMFCLNKSVYYILFTSTIIFFILFIIILPYIILAKWIKSNYYKNNDNNIKQQQQQQQQMDNNIGVWMSNGWQRMSSLFKNRRHHHHHHPNSQMNKTKSSIHDNNRMKNYQLSSPTSSSTYNDYDMNNIERSRSLQSLMIKKDQINKSTN